MTKGLYKITGVLGTYKYICIAVVVIVLVIIAVYVLSTIGIL